MVMNGNGFSFILTKYKHDYMNGNFYVRTRSSESKQYLHYTNKS